MAAETAHPLVDEGFNVLATLRDVPVTQLTVGELLWLTGVYARYPARTELPASGQAFLDQARALAGRIIDRNATPALPVTAP